ncbi:hypothetical protein PROFUN_10395 [Planoprotostelium fungivorum]|uniref:Uncharacterized protein n=1 Tax=Planoprotostelium fungivorum TaxID=1890364 RepID=A0A2P6NE01_9EUKA|nr:hypothetical protein PROFUN_10395 [Planoprotostelium fungivorum]
MPPTVNGNMIYINLMKKINHEGVGYNGSHCVTFVEILMLYKSPGPNMPCLSLSLPYLS